MKGNRKSCIWWTLVTAIALYPSIGLATQPESGGQVRFRGAAFPVAEEAGLVTIVVKRQQGDLGEVSVDYETSVGTATEGVDYLPVAGTLVWADGDREDKSFEIEIIDDAEDEGQEVFGVELSNPVGVEIGPPSVTVVRIKPSDRQGGGSSGPSNGTIRFVSAAYPAFEANASVTIEVERSGGSQGAASVTFLTIPGSAVPGEDYLETTGTLSWADGEDGVRSFDIPLVDDEDPEDLETITAVLTGAIGAGLGERDVASVVIIDDDGGEGQCVPDDTTLCLRGGRFQVVGEWEDFDGDTGSIHWIPSTNEAGLGWFFQDSNVELLLKILDGCPLNGHYWVFYAATTNVGYELEVTDLATGDVRTYVNPLGQVALATTDVVAFPTCDAGF